jgi:MFS family permease
MQAGASDGLSDRSVRTVDDDWRVPKPRWTGSSFLIYTGGLVVLIAAAASLSYLSDRYRSGAYVAWALLVVAVLAAIAHAFRRSGRWISAGIFAFATVIAFGAFVGALWSWFGWLSTDESAFGGFDVARLSLVLLTLIAAQSQLRSFRFPMIALLTLTLGWFLVTDVVSNGGSWTAVVTLLIGLFYLATGSASDRPTAFWRHLVAGLLISGSLLYWWHSSDWQWALVAVVALVYARIAALTGRSSWAVLSALGLLAPATHFTIDWVGGPFFSFGDDEDYSEPRVWVPLVSYAVTGFLIVVVGLVVARRRGSTPTG